MPIHGKTILIAVTNDLSHDRRMHRTCNVLSEAGCDVTLIGRSLPDSQPFDPDGFKAKRLRCFFHIGFLFYAEYNMRLFFYFMTNRYDIACAVDLDTVLAVRIASFFKRKTTVHDAHEYFTEVPELEGRNLTKGIWQAIGKSTVKHFDARYTVGQHLAEKLGKQFKASFEVIRNLPSKEQSRTIRPVDKESRMLVYAGALNEGRGIEEILQALRDLPGWRFRIAGEGDLSAQLRELSAQLNVSDRVEFLGWISPDDLPSIFRKATLGINVLKGESLNYYYSLANKFFDFIHAGLPSINMNFPEYASIQQQYACCYLINELSPISIVNAINDIENNPHLMQSMIEGCKRASDELTWEREAARLRKIYNSISN